MGIRGLESFIDSIYRSDDRFRVFQEVKLSDLKLVIDGNQFAYFVSSLFKLNAYGGDYDLFYNRLYKLLTKLKDSIEIIIFDGAKESIDKAKFRLEQRITRVAHVGGGCYHERTAEINQKYYEELQEHPAIFNRMILYKILNELNIKYMMVEFLADHVIASYAQGKNETGEKFTVVSKASFFNIYGLEKGYVSSKYLGALFQNPEQINQNTTLSVFYLSDLLKYFCFDSHLTWIYLCIILGNNDDPELARNMIYAKKFNLDMRAGAWMGLVAHMKIEEKHLLETNFSQVRQTYVGKENAAKKIDDLIDLFMLKNTDYKKMQAINGLFTINDYDRLYANIRHLKCNFINCFIEDCETEESIFTPVLDFFHMIYSAVSLREPAEKRFKTVAEYKRIKNPTPKELISVKDIPVEGLMDSKNPFINFLAEVNKRMCMYNVKDDLTLLFLGLNIWQNWYEEKCLDKRAEKASKEMFNTNAFIDSVFINLILITLKMTLNTHTKNLKSGTNTTSQEDPSTNKRDLTQNMFVKNLVKLLENDEEDSDGTKLIDVFARIVKTYKNFNNNPGETNLNAYFTNDTKIIHFINEFQAIYYAIGAYTKISSFKFDLLLPNCFLNSYFLCNLIKNKVTPFSRELTQLENMIYSCDKINTVLASLKEKYKYSLKTTSKQDLNKLMSRLNLKGSQEKIPLEQ